MLTIDLFRFIDYFARCTFSFALVNLWDTIAPPGGDVLYKSIAVKTFPLLLVINQVRNA